MVRKVHNYADGGKVTKRESNTGYGAPLSTPAPGATTRRRPKVGDKSSDTRLLNPRKAAPSKAADKPATTSATVRRDYRGIEGAIDDAEKGK